VSSRVRLIPPTEHIRRPRSHPSTPRSLIDLRPQFDVPVNRRQQVPSHRLALKASTTIRACPFTRLILSCRPHVAHGRLAMIAEERTAGVYHLREASRLQDRKCTRIAHSRSVSFMSSCSLLIAPDVFQHCEVVSTAQKDPGTPQNTHSRLWLLVGSTNRRSPRLRALAHRRQRLSMSGAPCPRRRHRRC
jgi:hypothetical protein